MTKYTLLNPESALLKLAELIGSKQELTLEVRENKCFAHEKWLGVGEVTLDVAEVGADVDEETSLQLAMQHGAFTWQVPELETLKAKLQECMFVGKIAPEIIDKGGKTLSEGLQDIARRLLLLLPAFDPEVMSQFPYASPTTLVVDTTAVKQGALDFACAFLYPEARIKVPSVVPVEILQMCDRFLKARRDKLDDNAKKLNCMQRHIESQGVQKALLRLEWHSKVEVERPVLGTDPLKDIYGKETDVKADGLESTYRSFIDRLIFETAKGHKTQINSDQPIAVLTSDQGLARMALAEGMYPIYFDARATSGALGKTLTGTLFHPFNSKLYTVSLIKVLWELATCFGSARLRCEAGEFEATAMSEEFTWRPYQTREDLLWCRWSERAIPKQTVIAPIRRTVNESPSILEATSKDLTNEATVSGREENLEPLKQEAAVDDEFGLTEGTKVPARIGSYVFSAEKMIRLITFLGQKRRTPIDEILSSLGVSQSTSRQYLQFLKSGLFVSYDTNEVTSEIALKRLQEALLTVNLRSVRENLKRIPSFAEYLQLVSNHQQEPDWSPETQMRHSTAKPYYQLAEISGLVLNVHGAGFIVTDAEPPLQTFCDVALSVYQELAVADPWALTGSWLERLAVRERIHPLFVRESLASAVEKKMLQRYTEGSTIDKRFENHRLSVLQNDEEGTPHILDYGLYHGDFLSSGRSSVRIRLEREGL